MSETDREREQIREILAEGHRSTRRRTPAFATLWSRAAAETRAPRRARKRGFAVAAVAAAMLAIATTIVLWPTNRQRPSEIERAMLIAASVSDWQAPFDFLLETPGQEWLESTPRGPIEPAAQSWNLSPDLLEPDSPRR